MYMYAASSQSNLGRSCFLFRLTDNQILKERKQIMNTYTNCLPAWSVGPDCYKEVPAVTCRFGKTAAVVGGKKALAAAYDKLAAAVAGSGLTLSAPVWYGGNSTYENVDMLTAMDEVKNADMVFAMGGGRVVDTCKAVAERLNKPLFTFPTIASNCAPVTAIAVIYNADDTFREYFYPTRCPLHTFLNTQVIAEAPEKLLWAGIGDALSKECEVELCTRGRDLPHTPLMGRTMAACCTDPLLKFGKQAMEECRANRAGNALEQVALCIVVSTGLVSNFVTTANDYYYNSSLAHCVYYGATMVPASGRNHLHGEIVSFGVLTLLTYDKNFARRDEIMAFNHSIGLPVTLAQVELGEENLQTVADKASTVVEWTCSLFTFTKEAFMQAMRDADAAGREYLANVGKSC